MRFSALARVVVLCIVSARLVHGSASAQQPDPQNAATWYQQAIDQCSNLTADEWNAITYFDPMAGPPSPQLRAALVKAASIIETYQQGTQQPYSDFGLDYSQGIEMMLPHISQMRQMARLTNAAAMVRMYDGDAAGAAELLASTYRSTPHVGDDQVLISTLVGQAIFALVDKGVQQGVDRGAFGQADAATLLKEVEQFQAVDDPFNYIGAATGEREMVVGWLNSMRDDPQERLRIAELVGDDGDGRWMQQIHQITEMPGEEFDAAVAQYDHVMERAVDIMSMDDPVLAKEQMAQLEAEIEAGEHGPLIFMMPAWSKSLERKLQGEEMIASRVEMLRSLASGEADPMDMANAAIWYLNAFTMLEQLHPHVLEQLRAFTAIGELERERPVNAAPSLLEQARPSLTHIIDVLDEASTIHRCDFSIVDTPITALAPKYAGSMRDALRLVHYNAVQLLREEKSSLAADRLATAYRMIGHFAGDPHMVCSILSHRAFLEAHLVVLRLNDTGELKSEALAALRASVDILDVADPFGYGDSRSKTAQNLRRVAAQHDREAELTQLELIADSPDLIEAFALVDRIAPRRTNVQIVEQADGDALLYYLALFQFSQQTEHAVADAEAIALAELDERERWAVLHDVLDLDALMATWHEARQTFAERGRKRSALRGLDVRRISALADRREHSRADVHATSRLLRQDNDADESTTARRQLQ